MTSPYIAERALVAKMSRCLKGMPAAALENPQVRFHAYEVAGILQEIERGGWLDRYVSLDQKATIGEILRQELFAA